VRLILVACLVLAAALPAAAGPVTGLTTFTPGMPARASEVNGNFGIVANAVNDNHTRLSTAETTLTGKQNRVTGTCAAGTAMTSVAADGSVTCAPVVPDGVIAVANSALSETLNVAPDACRIYHVPFRSGFYGTVPTDECSAVAPLTLPHGATLTDVSCYVTDNIPDGAIRVSLLRRSLGAETFEFAFETPPSVDSGNQTIHDDSPASGPVVVDNTANVYSLWLRFQLIDPEAFAPIGLNLSVTGCRVAYDAP
jgi:hypothetical protein